MIYYLDVQTENIRKQLRSSQTRGVGPDETEVTLETINLDEDDLCEEGQSLEDFLNEVSEKIDNSCGCIFLIQGFYSCFSPFTLPSSLYIFPASKVPR